MRIVWSPTARRRAQPAVDFFALDHPLASADWLDGLVRRVKLLREFPEQGRVVPEWHDPAVREILHPPYRITHEVAEGRVEVLTLIHVRQKLGPQPPSDS